MKSKITFLIAIILLYFTSYSQNYQKNVIKYGYIQGKVKDYITEKPMPNVQIKIYKRIVDILDGGAKSIRSMKEVIDLKIETITNKNGDYSIKVPIDNDPNYFMVTANYKDYEGMIAMFVLVEKNGTTTSDFELAKLNLTPKEMALLENKAMITKEKYEFEKSNDIQNNVLNDNHKYIPEENNWFQKYENKQSLPKSCSYSVPTQVCVYNLVNGYNSCAGTGCSGSSCIGSSCVLINFDDYIAGVVQGEIGFFSGVLEAKKAQAVAARTYSLNRYNLGLAVNCGQAYNSTISTSCATAASSTTTEVILYNGNVIDAKYSARCNGNYTQNSENGTWAPYSNCNQSGSYIPYLRSRPCSGHVNCNSTSETPCCYTTISTINTGGYIFGHGVGMCQRGAQGFANQGLDYCTILNNFYTNVCIANSSCSGSSGNVLNCNNYIQLNCGVTYNGASSSASSNVNTYGCNSWTETGPERVHKITASVSGTLTATISNFTGDLDVFILGSCDPSNCLGTVSSSSATYTNAVAGTEYYIIVDADDGSGSSYSLLVTCTSNNPTLPDLSVSNTSSSPTSACPGGVISVGSYVNNTGTASAGASTMKYYLSQNSVYDGSDVLLGSSSVSAINAGSSSSQIISSLTIPGGTAPGSYYILFYADANGAISESNESNNIAYRSITVNNCSSSPDLVISNVYFSTYSLCSGSNIDIDFDVENIGGATAAASTVKFYLSSNNTYGSGDVLLGSTSVVSLAANNYISFSKTLTVPSGTTVGTWYILIIADADNTVSEGTNGENNNLFADAVSVVSCSGLADLIITYNSHTPSTVNPGTHIVVDYTRENVGSITAAAQKIGIYISTDNNFDPNIDTYIDDWSKGSLAAGASSTGTLSFDIPNCNACGTFYIFLFIDYLNVVNESNESNNYDSFQIQITGCTTCSYSIPPTGISFQSSGGSGNFAVTTTECCEWTATTNDTWITIVNGSDYGNGTVNYAVAPCSGGGTRSGIITVAGQTHTITQNCTQSCNNSQTFIWGVQAGSTTLSDEANDLAIDASGNLYMTGDIQGTATFGGGITLTTPSNAPDIFVSKHNSSGVIQWAVKFGDTDQEYGTGIATDNSGNIYVIGVSANDITFGSTTLTINGTNEEIAFLIKLNPSGVLQWAKKINPDYSAYITDIFIDNNNNIFVTGGVSDYVGSSGDGFLIAKYNTSGTQIWYNTYGFGVYVKNTYGITSDNLGNIVVVGRYMQTMTLGSTTLNASASLDMDGFIAKLSSSGTVLWAKNMTSPGQGQDALMSVVTDAGNNIYTVGHVDSTAIVGGIIIPLNDGDKEIIIKYDQSGNPVWVKASQVGWANNRQRITLGNDNNIYIAGCFADSLQLDSIIITGFGSNDGFIGCIDTSGTIKWLKGFGSTQAEGANGIVLNSTNDVFVAGGFRGTVIFGATTLTSTGSTDIYLAKFKQCDPPLANITYTGSLSICTGESKSLSTTFCSSFSYQWFLNNVAINGATLPSYDATQAGSYKVQVASVPGCETMSNTIVLTSNTILPPTISGNNKICEPNTTTTINAGNGYSSYSWSNGSTSQIISVGAGNYSVTVTNSSGCSSNSSIQVTLNQLPEVEAGNDTTISSGASVIIGGFPSAFGNGPFIYNWIPSTGLNNSTISNPIASPGSTIEYTLFVTDNNGCIGSDSVIVTVGPVGILETGQEGSFYIYPNPTGDIIYIKGIYLPNEIISVRLTNVLGQNLISESIDVINEKIETKFDLSKFDIGVYFIIISYDKGITVNKVIKK